MPFSQPLIAQEQSASELKSYVFTNVSVITMNNEEILEDQHVVVEEGRIVSIEPSAEKAIVQGAQEIDGKGKFLIPGLAEMHGHIPGEEQPQYAEDVLFLYIANGVTTVRNMLGTNYQLQLRDRVRNGELPGPTIFAASPWLSKDAITTPEAADKIVREHKANGFDLLKIGNIEPEVYKQMALT
ncbi:MAG TPA: hypothetical protein VK941_03825, partial [Gillisia sp.]|nr:hypothetical protein [Gillisia sp.]